MASANIDPTAVAVEVRMTRVYHWCAILGSMIVPIAAVYFGIARHQTALVLGGAAGLVVISMLGALALRSAPSLMKISPEGLYVRQYKCCLDWRDIKRAYVVDMAERMSKGEKVAAAAVGNHSLSLAMLIGLEFTESGLLKHGVLADSLWQRQHNDHAVVRTHLFALGKGAPDSIPALVEEIERFRVEHSGDGVVDAGSKTEERDSELLHAGGANWRV